MSMKCDKCNKPAVVHELVIVGGKQAQTHLCAEHAADAVPLIPAAASIVEALRDRRSQGLAAVACGGCGMTHAEFKKHRLAGCPRCYEALASMIEERVTQAQNGRTHHCGRIPARRDGAASRLALRADLQAQLDAAVAAERYEVAAQLRNQLRSTPLAEQG